MSYIFCFGIIWIAYVSSKQPTVFKTRQGKVQGIIFRFRSPFLKPAEVISDIAYGNLDESFRFRTSKHPIDTWMGIRLFPHWGYRFVCHQSFTYFKQTSADKPLKYLDHLKRIQPYCLNQADNCLGLNLFIPMKGR